MSPFFFQRSCLSFRMFFHFNKTGQQRITTMTLNILHLLNKFPNKFKTLCLRTIYHRPNQISLPLQIYDILPLPPPTTAILSSPEKEVQKKPHKLVYLVVKF